MPTETLLSPGVLLQETDKSFIPQGTDPSGLAIIGPTAKGPVDLPTQINNYGEFRAIFGTTIRNGTQKEEYFTHLAVKNYFENGGSSAIVTRVASGSWSTATNTPISSSTGAVSGQVKSDASLGAVSHGDEGASGYDEGTYTVATGTDGSGTGLTLDVVIDGDGSIDDITVNQQGSDYAGGDSITIDATLLGQSGGTTTLAALAAGDVEDIESATPFQLKTLGQGTVFNNSINTSTIPTKESNGTYETSSKDAVKWEIKDLNNAQGTFSLIVRRGDDTDNAPIILEQFTECSLDPLSPNYIARKIGDMDRSATLDASTGDYLVTDTGEFDNMSKYIRVSAVNLPTYQYINNAGDVGVDSSNVSYSASLPIAGFGGFAGATGDVLSTVSTENRFGSASSRTTSDIQGLSNTDYDKAISLLKNKDEYKFNTLVAPGLNQSVHSSTIDTIITNTTQRGDSLFVADLEPYGASTAEVTAEAADIDSSFAASYWPWVQVFSSELNKNIWCPASTIIPGVYSKNDSISAPWFAPAGENRGRVGRLVTGVEKKLSKATRDTLYSNKVNPIVSFRDSGILIFGQKTLQADKSALDRVNVRRLLLTVKQRIGAMADGVLFEQNTEATRQSFLQQANPYLTSLVQRQGLYAYRIVMDESNNTPDVIDNNQLVGQVFLQPTKTAEFVVIDFTLTRTGASFTD